MKPAFAAPIRGGSSSSAPVYWFESGVVYQMPSGGSSATIVVGFADFNRFAAYCSRGGNWGAAPSSFYVRTAFSATDFPVAQDTAPNPNKNPQHNQYQIFASQFAAPLATSFMASAGITIDGEHVPSMVYTLISWSQASALAVQSGTGPKTVSLTYLTLSQSKTARLGTEIIWIGPPLA